MSNKLERDFDRKQLNINMDLVKRELKSENVSAYKLNKKENSETKIDLKLKRSEDIEKESINNQLLTRTRGFLKVIRGFELRVFLACVYLVIFWGADEWTKVKWVLTIFIIGGVYSGIETSMMEIKNVGKEKKIIELKNTARSKMSGRNEMEIHDAEE